MPKKPDSPTKLGYRVGPSPPPSAPAPPGLPAGRRDARRDASHTPGAASAAGRGFGSFSLACSRSGSTTGLLLPGYGPDHHRAAPGASLGDAPGFAAAKEVGALRGAGARGWGSGVGGCCEGAPGASLGGAPPGFAAAKEVGAARRLGLVAERGGQGGVLGRRCAGAARSAHS